MMYASKFGCWMSVSVLIGFLILMLLLCACFIVGVMTLIFFVLNVLFLLVCGLRLFMVIFGLLSILCIVWMVFRILFLFSKFNVLFMLTCSVVCVMCILCFWWWKYSMRMLFLGGRL